jgi:hypothetical protein
MGKNLKGILTDELLDHLAERFLFYSVRDFLGITFEQFLGDPEHYMDRTCELVGVIAEDRQRMEREAARRIHRIMTYCGTEGTCPLPQMH